MGVSFDAPAKNAAWAEDEGFRFELWSDLDRELALHYGAASSRTQSNASRTTRLLDADGRELLRYDSVNVATSPADVLSDCETLFGR